MKTPEIWQECIRCRGAGCIKWSEMGQQQSVTCWACEGSALPGYRAILYTPEQWEAAGGVLHYDMPVFALCSGIWVLMHLVASIEDFQSAEKTIIATPAVTMKDLEKITTNELRNADNFS